MKTWSAWLVGTIGSFAALEYYAIRHRRFPPLTDVLRVLLGIRPARSWGRLASCGFIAFWLWLCAHLLHTHVEEVAE